MGLLILPADFIGVHKIAQTAFSDLTDFIATYEEKLLIDLLGKELFDLFKADVTNHLPVAQIYLDIFNPVMIECDGQEVYNNGMKSMITGLIYGEYVSRQPVKNTASGAVSIKIDVARGVGFYENSGSNQYNEAVRDYIFIQDYIRKNLSDYPTFKGNKKTMWHWSL